MPYPGAGAERRILERYDRGFDAHDLEAAGIQPVLTPEDLRELMTSIAAVTVDGALFDYITAVVDATRTSSDLLLGASPRASIALLVTAKTLAAIRGRGYITPDDVKTVAFPTLRHRLILKPEAEIEGLTPDRVVDRILTRIPVPR